MSFSVENILRKQLLTALVSRAISCPITQTVLDVRTCVTFTDSDGDPAYVISPEGWEAVKTNPRARSYFEGRGFILPNN